MKPTLPLVIMILFIAETAFAQVNQPVEPDTTEYRNRVLLLPAIGSSPETGFLFGAVIVPQFKMGNAGPETRSSSILFSGIYTVRNQIMLSILPDLILPQEEWIFSGNYFLNYFPENNWGVGANTRDEDEMSVIYTQLNLEQSVLRKLYPSVFIGPHIHWSKLYNVKFEDADGNRIETPGFRGSEGSTVTGLGLKGSWDKRNSNMTPTENHFIELTIISYPSWAGSTDPYSLYQLDSRKYINLSGNAESILALQGLIQLTTGTPSFVDMPKLGGDRINRGYYYGRFRDQNSAQIQAELRQHLKGRFGFTLFAATGEVWNRFEDFSMNNYKWTAGLGLRFNLNPDDQTNIRIDFGIGKDTAGFYLQFGEAF
jgi:hypothetical protein